jgi:two-component system, OmpR family, sensor histidine kinase VicK
LYGVQNATDAILRLVSKSRVEIGICGNYMVLSAAIGDGVFKKILIDAKARGIKLRYATEITKQNVAYCKELMEMVELRHLDGLKGNFILNETEHLSISTKTLQEGKKNIPQIIHNNIKEIVEQQQYIFDTFWNKTISAQEKIREIEEGVEPFSIDVIRDRKRAESLLISEIQHAKSEVLVAVGSSRSLENLAEIGVLDSMKQAKGKGVNIMILYSEEGKSDDASTEQLISSLKMYVQIKIISGIRGSILIIDNTKLLTIGEEEDEALAVYSDNKFLVKNFGSLLDSLWSETEILESIIVVKDNLAESNKQLAQANEQLKIREKMQQEFINIAAHELRTPIMPILGYAELFEAQLQEEEQEQGMEGGRREKENHDNDNKINGIKAIIRNAKRLEQVSEFILDITKIESATLNLNKEELDINDIILNAMDDLLLDIVKDSKIDKIKLKYEPRGDNILVKADRSRLTQVISNLLNNANKFTKEGVISITTTKDEDSQGVIVSIQDTGPGIDPEIMPRLFSKFATKSTRGSGLGLFVCKSIIEAHGGNIWAENNKDCKIGGGATFTFRLPLSEKTEPANKLGRNG